MRTPAEAIQWATAQRTWTPFSCLNFWANAYYAGTQSALGQQGIALPTAKSAWNASQYKVTDGSLPPLGGLMYFDGIPGDEAGDVQGLTGDVVTWRTDVGTAGHLGSVPVMWMRDTIHHPYLGWTRDVLGTVLFPASGETTASTGTETLITPIKPLEEDDMELRVIIADAAADKKNQAYGSTAVITAHRGFVQTSTGLGTRAKLNEWTAAAGACGLTISITHVSVNAFNLAKLF